MQIEEFDYELPKELIAQYPSEKREESNLLVLYRKTGKIEHRKFYNIGEYLEPGDVLILNETKVIPARLIGMRNETGGKVEVFLLKRLNTDEWEVLISPHRVKKPGVKIEFGPDFGGEIKSINPKPTFKFHWHGDFDTLLQEYGSTPLPPYIKREPDESDKNRYQTVYAKVPGACAAPTAGLHFTQSLLAQLKERGVEIANIVLHTGLGSFKPIKCKKVEEHKMEPEYYEIPKDTAHKINSAKRRIAVGTTTVRALESATCLTSTKKDLATEGSPAHNHMCGIGVDEPRSDGTGFLSEEGVPAGWTDKFIYPHYEFKVVDALITNFHLPKSTLLLLVCAFASKELIFKAYKEAIVRGYNFYSYGDAMLII